MHSLLHDVRAAVASWRRSPYAAFFVVLTLVIGVGTNTIVFSVVNALLLRPLPYPESHRLVTLWDAARDGRSLGLTAPEYLDFRDRTRALDGLAGYATGTANLTGDGEAVRLHALFSTANFARVLRVEPEVGTFFDETEDRPGGAPAVMISHALWQSRFAAARDVVGRTLTLDGVSRTIRGVMPPSLAFPDQDVDCWIPLALDPSNPVPGDRWVNTVARLADQVGESEARAELTALAATLKVEHQQRFPAGANVLSGVSLVSLRDLLVGGVRAQLLVLLGAVALLLTIACANVASLLMGRAEDRRHELLVRSALGADRARLLRQLLVESALLALVGGSVGVLVAVWGSPLVGSLGGFPATGSSAVVVDLPVILYCLGLSLATGLASGIYPALSASKTNLADGLRSGGRDLGTGIEGKRFREALVVAEIALAVTLLSGAGLLANSFFRLSETNPGFGLKEGVTAELSLPASKYSDPARIQLFYRDLLDQAGVLPGVASAAITHLLPLSGRNADASYQVDGQVPAPGEAPPNADYRIVSAGYFRTMDIPLRAGRTFAEPTGPDGPLEAVVSQSFARASWPDGNPIGQRVRWTAEQPWMTVVGVVDDVLHRGLGNEARATLYVPVARLPFGSGYTPLTVTLVLAASAETELLSLPLRRLITRLDPDIPVSRIQTIRGLLAQATSRTRFASLLISGFAGVALLLTGLGIYGVLAHSVTRGRREIAVRLALGGGTDEVRRLFTRRVVRLVGSGLAAGLLLSVVALRLSWSIFYGVTLRDAGMVVAVFALVTLCARISSHVPLRRAMRIDPMPLLRGD